MLNISRLLIKEAGKTKTEQLPKKKELVIVDPAGPKDFAGGYHPRYWTIAHYTSLFEATQTKLFLQTIHQIEQNVPSKNYTVNDDDSISIHIHQQEKAYATSIECSLVFLEL